MDDLLKTLTDALKLPLAAVLIAAAGWAAAYFRAQTRKQDLFYQIDRTEKAVAATDQMLPDADGEAKLAHTSALLGPLADRTIIEAAVLDRKPYTGYGIGERVKKLEDALADADAKTGMEASCGE